MRKLLLLPLLLCILLISNCKKQNKSAGSEDKTDPISEKLRSNADYQRLITSSNDVRNETIRILQPLIQSKKKRISELPAELQQSIRKQLAESKLILSAKSTLWRITGAIPELKSLPRQEFLAVLKQARQMVNKDLNLKFKLTSIGNARVSSDHPCEDSCEAVYGPYFELAEDAHNASLVNCMAHKIICEQGCSNDPCKAGCQTEYDSCEEAADAEYMDWITTVANLVLDCWYTCIPDPA